MNDTFIIVIMGVLSVIVLNFSDDLNNEIIMFLCGLSIIVLSVVDLILREILT
jgi:hypothetical protein